MDEGVICEGAWFKIDSSIRYVADEKGIRIHRSFIAMMAADLYVRADSVG
jgi:hypothetical protein